MKTKPYKRWCVATPPTQLIKIVWGLGRHPTCVDVTLISDDLQLMSMDAPNIIPTGSTWREEHHADDAIYQAARTAYAPREGRPWCAPLLAGRRPTC